MTSAVQERVGETMKDLHALHESLELPDGYRSEIIDGSITVSSTPSFRHAKIVKQIERAISRSECGDLMALQVATVESAETGERYIPDLVVLPEALVEGEDWDGPDWIRPTEAVEFALEVVSPSSALHGWRAKA